MLNPGPAKKVSIYVGEDQQYHGHTVYLAILEFLLSAGVSDAQAIRAMAGFGADHKMHTTRILRLTENLPVKVQFVESAEKVDEVMPKLREIVEHGLIEVQDTIVVKST